MRISRTRVVLAAIAGCGVSLAIAFAPAGCIDPNRAGPDLPGIRSPSVDKPSPAAAPAQHTPNIPTLTPAAIVLDAGMITDASRPVDAAP